MSRTHSTCWSLCSSTWLVNSMDRRWYPCKNEGISFWGSRAILPLLKSKGRGCDGDCCAVVVVVVVSSANPFTEEMSVTTTKSGSWNRNNNITNKNQFHSSTGYYLGTLAHCRWLPHNMPISSLIVWFMELDLSFAGVAFPQTFHSHFLVYYLRRFTLVSCSKY